MKKTIEQHSLEQKSLRNAFLSHKGKGVEALQRGLKNPGNRVTYFAWSQKYFECSMPHKVVELWTLSKLRSESSWGTLHGKTMSPRKKVLIFNFLQKQKKVFKDNFGTTSFPRSSFVRPTFPRPAFPRPYTASPTSS